MTIQSINLVFPTPKLSLCRSLCGDRLGLVPGLLLLAAAGYGGKSIGQFIARYGKARHLVLPTSNMFFGPL